MKLVQKNLTLKILIADDDPDDRQLLALAFREAQLTHAVDFVKNGEELMAYLKSSAEDVEGHQLPDLILLDLNMPKKDGRVALEEIKSNPKLDKLNIVIFSTSISKEDNSFVYKLGVTNCVTKPCGFNELVEIIKGVCDSINDKLLEDKI